MDMRIVFQLVPEEFQRFNLYHLRHDKLQKQQILMFRWSLLIFCMVIGFFMYRNMCPPGTEGFRLWLGIICSFGGMGATGVIMVITLPRQVEKSVRRRIEKQIKAGGLEPFFLPKAVSLEADGIVDVSEATSSRMAYGALQKIAYDGDLTYVYTTAVSAVVIPDRAFASMEEKASFFIELNQRMSV